jgi:PBP1b-binding outer membrane lipoprotein LpoB
MKRFPFAMLLFCAAFFFVSCNNGNDSDEKTTETKTDSNATKPVATEVNTIVTTPVNMVSVTHKIKDFAKWLPMYEAHDSMKLANGIHNYVVSRGFADSNTLMVALKVDDLDKAKAFMKDPSLKKAMQQSGVVGTPMVSFMTAVWQDTAMLPPGTLRIGMHGSRISRTASRKEWTMVLLTG